MGRPKGSKLKWDYKGKTIEERFWDKVNILGKNDCWEWKAFVHPSGYGMFAINRQMKLAHRISWEFTFGEIPNGMCVLHKCDNRKCENPYHLFLGTYLDNAQDRDNKGRAKIPCNIGERHGNSKLTNEKVIKARSLFSTGEYTYTDLAIRFDVARQTITKAIQGENWSHVK